jgi:uncharacterized protein (DUF1810 family)
VGKRIGGASTAGHRNLGKVFGKRYAPGAAMPEFYDLDRFVAAQASVYARVCEELRAGRKASHWMWFIFPQIAGLGVSATACRFALASRAEAAAYLQHPVLGPRLIECTMLVNRIAGRSAFEIFGSPDDLKFRSSMTLFAEAAPDTIVFKEALQKYFVGEPDRQTLDRL